MLGAQKSEMKHDIPDLSERNSARSVFPELAPAGSLNSGQTSASSAIRTADAFTESKIAAIGGHVKAATLSFSNMHEYGDLLANYMRARKRVFIDELKWDLPHVDGMEYDQYDIPISKWLVIHEYGEILGGMRLMPTTSKCGIYSYMLRDAQRGLLENIPTDVLFIEAPVHETVWEGTRLFVSDNINSTRRTGINLLLMRHMIATARELNVSHMIGFVPSHWYRWTRRLGMHAIPVGPKIEIDGVTSQAALMKVGQVMN